MKSIGKGWVEGSVQEFLGLSHAEAAYVEAKAALTRAVRERRLALGLSQTQLAKALGTSQSRFSFIERGDPSVSLDLIIRALFETGLDRKGVAAVMAGKALVPQRKAASRKTRRAVKIPACGEKARVLTLE